MPGNRVLKEYLIDNICGLEGAYIWQCHGIPFKRFSFYDGQKVEDMPKPLPERDFWKKKLMERGYFNYSKNLIANILDEHLGFMIDYCKRFSCEELNEKELNKPKPDTFKGPYLPVPAEVEKIKQLVIPINWNFPPNFFNYKKRSIEYVNNKHLEMMIKRWEHFQEEFGIYDLRPLLGIRCAYIQKNEDGELDFTFYRLLDTENFKNFHVYITKDVPTLKFQQAKNHIAALCDSYTNGRFHLGGGGDSIEGLELNFLDMIFEKYEKKLDICRRASVLIGKRHHQKYRGNAFYQKYRHIPLQCGPWSKEEELQLLCNVAHCYGTNNLKEILSSTKKLSQKAIFQYTKMRYPHIISNRWATMKQQLTNALYRSNSNGRDELSWTNEDTITLIDSIYHSDAKSLRSIDWANLMLKFPGFCDDGLRRKLTNLIKIRVPSKIARNFDDAIEYLYHKVKPIFKLKDIRSKNMRDRFDLVVSYREEMARRDISRVRKYFENVDRDEGEERSLLSTEGESSFAEEERRNNSEGDSETGQRSPVVRDMISAEEEGFCWQVIMSRSNYKSRYVLRDVTEHSSTLSFVPMASEFSNKIDPHSNVERQTETCLESPTRLLQTGSRRAAEDQLRKEPREIDSFNHNHENKSDSVTVKVERHGKRHEKGQSDEGFIKGQKYASFRDSEIGSCSLDGRRCFTEVFPPEDGEASATTEVFRKKKKKRRRREDDGSPVNVVHHHRKKKTEKVKQKPLERAEEPMNVLSGEDRKKKGKKRHRRGSESEMNKCIKERENQGDTSRKERENREDTSRKEKEIQGDTSGKERENREDASGKERENQGDTSRKERKNQGDTSRDEQMSIHSEDHTKEKRARQKQKKSCSEEAIILPEHRRKKKRKHKAVEEEVGLTRLRQDQIHFGEVFRKEKKRKWREGEEHFVKKAKKKES